MATQVERHENGALKQIVISCDVEGCVTAPGDDEIIASGGLKNMGWYCSGGQHFCPDHAKERK